MRQFKLSQLSLMTAQAVLLVFIFVVDLTQSSDSVAAFSSAKKVTSADNSLSSSNRHKRRVSDDAFFGDGDEARQALQVLKRAPGWGKRSFESVSDVLDDDSYDQDYAEKRAPGWGKRAPGWGKRAPGWGKRAPGWGKRAPGWGKRAPGWGKRSESSELCQNLDILEEAYLIKAQQIKSVRAEKCGSQETGQ